MQGKLIKLICFQIIAVAMVFLFIEGMGQVLFFIKYDRWYRGQPMQTSGGQKSLIISHPRIGYSLNSNYQSPENGIFINLDGFRDNDLKEGAEQNGFNVLLLGDSCAFGWHRNTHTDQSKIFPAILEDRLTNKLNKNVNIINTGVPGYSSYEVLLSFREYKAKFHPDYVMVYIGFNDIGIGISEGIKGDQNIKRDTFDNVLVDALQPGFLDRVNQYLTFKSVVYSKMRNLLTGFGKGEMGSEKYQNNAKMTLNNEIIFNNYYRNLKTLIREAQNDQIEVILISLTHIYDPDLNEEELTKRRIFFPPYDDYKTFSQLTAKLNDLLLKIKEEDHVFLFRLDQKFSGLDKTKLFVDHVHFSEQGHETVAQFLLSEISKLNLHKDN